MSLRSFFAAALVFFSVTPALHAQTTSSDSLPTFKSKVRVVPIDVVVTNNKGEPVTGLKPEDFQIFEQGKAQTIASFQEYTGAPAVPASPSNLPPNVFTNRDRNVHGEAVTILLMDALNTPLDNQLFVHQQVLKYFHSMKPGMAVAIFKLSSRLRLLQSFTTDSSAVEAVLRDNKIGTWPELSPMLRTHNDWDLEQKNLAQISDRQTGLPATSVAAAQQFQTESAASQVDLRVQLTLDSFQQLASYLAAVPGRKNVIWFSRSFPLTIFPAGNGGNMDSIRDYNRLLQKTSSLLSKAQVAIYPIGAEGLRVPDQSDSIDDPALRDPAASAALSEVRTDDVNHVSMEALAEETGGKAIYNGNSLVEAIDRSIHHGTQYYTLSYSPTNKKTDGSFRSIRIKIGQDQYKLDYRRGYYADDAKTLKAEADKAKLGPLVPLMARGLPSSTQITYEILLQPAAHQPSTANDHAGDNTSLKGPVTRYTAVIRIPSQDIKQETAQDGSRHGKIEMNLVAYDRQGNPLNWITRSIQIDTKADEPSQTKDIAFTQEIDVPQGDIYLRSGIYDPASDKAGTIEVPLSQITMAKNAVYNK